MDIDAASDYDSDTNPNHAIVKTTVGGDRVHFNFRKNQYYELSNCSNPETQHFHKTSFKQGLLSV